MERMRSFFTAVRPKVVAPSSTLFEFWRQNQSGLVYSGVEICPPGEISFGPGEATKFSASRPLRVGFLGGCAYHKGWQAFEALVKWHALDERYEFVLLGSQNPQLEGLEYRAAQVTPNDRAAMARAVASAKLDVVVNWSLCFESFSFTALEAVAGGAFVIAKAGAGNVWPLVSRIHPHRGIAVDTEVELSALFATGEILALAAEADRRIGRIETGAGAFGVVTGGAGA